MVVTLNEKPQKPIVIQGFPGIGLIGSIVTEFLVNQPGVRQIGNIFLPEMQPVVIIHEQKVMHPAGIYYYEQYNMVIIHTLGALQGMEWQFADAILELNKELNTWEILSIEGILSQEEKTQVFGYANNDEGRNKINNINMSFIKEGIIMGVSAALMLKAKNSDVKMMGLYATTHSQLPDSEAAAEVIKKLDTLFNFNIDPTPLHETAKVFEEKVKNIMSQSQSVKQEQNKTLNYVG